MDLKYDLTGTKTRRCLRVEPTLGLEVWEKALDVGKGTNHHFPSTASTAGSFRLPHFLPLLQGFSVNFPPDGGSTLRCREKRESKQADGDGRDFSALSSSPETNLWNTSHGGAGDCGEGCVPTGRAPPLAPSLPCWLITSQAAALGRLRRITCPFREAALDLVRRLAGVRAPSGATLLKC